MNPTPAERASRVARTNQGHAPRATRPCMRQREVSGAVSVSHCWKPCMNRAAVRPRAKSNIISTSSTRRVFFGHGERSGLRVRTLQATNATVLQPARTGRGRSRPSRSKWRSLWLFSLSSACSISWAANCWRTPLDRRAKQARFSSPATDVVSKSIRDCRIALWTSSLHSQRTQFGPARAGLLAPARPVA
jgi:hypothetical protein